MAATSTEADVLGEPVDRGPSVTFTATVTSNGNPVTTGTIDFLVDAAPADAGVALDGSGQATFTTHSLPAGTHAVQADYSGTDALEASTGAITQVVDIVADGGGPYAIDEGADLAVDGSGSTAGTGATFSWDVNDDDVVRRCHRRHTDVHVGAAQRARDH